jgi:hypothetical protein
MLLVPSIPLQRHKSGPFHNLRNITGITKTMNFSILRFIAVAVAIKVVAADCYKQGLKMHAVGTKAYDDFTTRCVQFYRYQKPANGQAPKGNDCYSEALKQNLVGTPKYDDFVTKCVQKYRY